MMTIAVNLDMTLWGLLNCYQSYEGTCIWEIWSFYPVVKICRTGLLTKMNSLYRNAQRFHIRTHTRVEPVVKRLFIIGKPKWRKKVLKRVA